MIAKRKNSNLKKNNKVDDTFYELHKRIKNGPIMTIGGDIKNYAQSRESTIQSANVGSYSSYKTAIKKLRPCGILLAKNEIEWHWVVGVGYREYNSGQHYL